MPTETQAAETVEEAAPAPDIAGQWRDATEKVRSTIKWVVAGFASVGAILVGTAPLTGLAKVRGAWWLVAVLGGVLAIGGVIVAVWKASDVLLPDVTTLADIQHATTTSALGRLRDRFLFGEDGFLRLWGASVEEFREARNLEYKTLKNLRNFNPPDGAKPAIEQAKKDTIAKLDQIRGATQVVLAAGDFALVRGTALDRRKWIAYAAVLVAAGTALFTLAVSRPDQETPSGDPRSGRRALVVLTPDGQRAYGQLLGSSCPASGFPAVVTAGATAGPWDVVATGEGGCTPARLVLKPEQGRPVFLQAQPVRMRLTDAGKEAFGTALGGSCPLEDVPALQLSGEGPWEVLVKPEEGCSSAQFTVTKAEATLVPSS